MSNSFTQTITTELGKILLPLRRLDNPGRVAAFIRELGWGVQDPSRITLQLNALSVAINNLGILLTQPADFADEEAFNAYLEAIEAAYQGATDAFSNGLTELENQIVAIRDSLTGNTNNLGAAIPRRVTDYLFVTYLSNHQPKLFAVLHFLGVLNEEAVSGHPGLSVKTIYWERIPRVITNPIDNFNADDTYNWENNFHGQEFLNRLHVLTRAFLIPGGIYEQNGHSELRIPIRQSGVWPGNWTELGLIVMPIPENNAFAGIRISPYVESNFNFEQDLSESWTVELNGRANLEPGLGLEIRPRFDLSVQSSIQGGFNLELVFTKDFDPNTGLVLLGSPTSTNLSIQSMEFKVFIEKGSGDEGDFGVGVGLKPISLDLKGGDGDGFLQSLIPDGGGRIDLDLDLGYTMKQGFIIDGSVSLQLRFNINKKFGPLKILDLLLQLDLGDGSIGIGLANSLEFSLGPIGGTIRDIGINANLQWPGADPYQNWAITAGFKPPSGIGIDLDIGLASGGGFIGLEPDIGRYSGALEIEMFGYGLTAVGILSTKDRSGRDLPSPGFSFLIIITAQNLSIQLGFGFMLDGVGGLIGIHRTFSRQNLEDGIRDGILDSIMFPVNPIENMPRIINDIDRVFPAQMDQFIFGPLLQVVWGKPAIFKIEAGILIELPDPFRIVILGQLHALLPTDDFPIVELNVDLRGELNFEKKQLDIIVSLRDCRLAFFKMEGSMALLIDWGSTPDFLLSVGGYHPDFIPPPNFPELDRIRVAMNFFNVVRFSIEGYFAISSNSFQFGAEGRIFVGIDEANINGWLIFDGLIVFSPFHFSFYFSQGFEVEVGGVSVLGFSISGWLSGPAPFRIAGEGCVSLLILDVCIGFELEFGEEDPEVLPPTDPWPELKATIENEESWQTSLPPHLHLVASFRQPEISSVLVVHPMGLMRMRQKVLPLNLRLDKYREFSIIGQRIFQIREVLIGEKSIFKEEEAGQNATSEFSYGTIDNHFAPGQFKDLSDADKLELSSYEPMVSGFSVGNTRGAFTVQEDLSTNITERALKYEEKYVDRPDEPSPISLIGEGRQVQLAKTAAGAKAYSKLFSMGANKYQERISRPELYKLKEESYIIARTDVLEPHPDIDQGQIEPMSRMEAPERLDLFLQQHPEERTYTQVISITELNQRPL